MSEVRLIGRLGSQVLERELPSGDVLTVFAIIVDRARQDRRGKVSVDTIPCTTTRNPVVRVVNRLEPGQWVEANGVLRRRFWRSGAGLSSAVEVEVRTVRRLRAS